jgi:hypothetical protein
MLLKVNSGQTLKVRSFEFMRITGLRTEQARRSYTHNVLNNRINNEKVHKYKKMYFK